MQTTITTETLKNFIGGQWVSAQTERSIDVPNPATGVTLAYVPLSTREDLDKAVEAAKEAFKIWSKTAAANGKRVQALAGAKNHSIVMPDADLDLAVKNIIGAAFGSAGERCMACAVVVAVGDIADKLVDRLKEEADNIKIGNGLEEGVFLGPVIRDSHKDRTLGYIEAGEQEGAQLVRDGREDDAVNGACLYTDSAKAVRQFRDEIDAGMLGVNVGVPAPMAFFPFSGYKKSFYGDLHANGRDGVEFYTRKKMLTARY
jgi:malonate-semialdehyde dehydrogenase (acetylating)/methylmalonate-semialdehyde dehydrogenase